jgi:hypothetical protein
MQTQCSRALADALYLPSILQLPFTANSVKLVLKGMARLLAVSDPVREHLRRRVAADTAYQFGD